MKITSSYRAGAGIGLAALLLATACASGRQPPQQGGSDRQREADQALGGKVARPIGLLFAGMDLNQDHVIDEAELNKGILNDWTGFGLSGHSGLSALGLAEWSVHALGDADALPNNIAFDSNFDGQISESEFRARLISEFAALDRNHDRRLTRAELLMDAPARPQSGSTMPRGDTGPGGPSGGGPGGSRPPR
jgi:hypothetical protein